MTTTGAILADLDSRSVRLSISPEGKLRVCAPGWALDEVGWETLSRQKPELLELVRQREGSADSARAEILALVDQLSERRPGWGLPDILRDVVTGYHRAGDPLLFLTGDTVRRILANLESTPNGTDLEKAS
jgi:hypothetical protein